MAKMKTPPNTSITEPGVYVDDDGEEFVFAEPLTDEEDIPDGL